MLVVTEGLVYLTARLLVRQRLEELMKNVVRKDGPLAWCKMSLDGPLIGLA